MAIIKRYSNRKLYDTQTKQYVTLDDLAELVRGGEDVKVIDHATGEDLTTLTLFQILFEQEKRIGGLLPEIVLTRLIRSGGEALSSLRKSVVNGLNPISPPDLMDVEITRRVQALVDSGQLSAEDGARLRNQLLAQSQTQAQADVIHEAETTAPETVPIDAAPAEEVAQLQRQLDALEAELASLRNQ